MTDQEHADAIAKATAALNEAIRTAGGDGLNVDIDAERAWEWEGTVGRPQDVYLVKARVTRLYPGRIA